MRNADESTATLPLARACSGDCAHCPCRAAEAPAESRSLVSRALMRMAERFPFPAILLPSLG